VPKIKGVAGLYVILCFVGAVLEWAYGTFWSVVGQTPWVYPNSILRYTSFEGLPLWGVGGLICVIIYRAYTGRLWRLLLWILPLLLFAALWVTLYSMVLQ